MFAQHLTATLQSQVYLLQGQFFGPTKALCMQAWNVVMGVTGRARVDTGQHTKTTPSPRRTTIDLIGESRGSPGSSSLSLDNVSGQQPDTYTARKVKSSKAVTASARTWQGFCRGIILELEVTSPLSHRAGFTASPDSWEGLPCSQEVLTRVACGPHSWPSQRPQPAASPEPVF